MKKHIVAYVILICALINTALIASIYVIFFSNPFSKPAPSLRQDVDAAISYVGGINKGNFPIFSTRIRTYNVVPWFSGVSWPWGGEHFSYLRWIFVIGKGQSNIVMLRVSNPAEIDDLLVSSSVSPGYRTLFKQEFSRSQNRKEQCHFARFYSREGRISKGVIFFNSFLNIESKANVVDASECASFGADFINGLPSEQDAGSPRDMPGRAVRALIVDAMYECALMDETNVQNLDRSGDGLAEVASKTCIVNALIKTPVKDD